MPDDQSKPKKPPARKGPIPGAPKKGRPGHNGGGWLMSGLHEGNRGKVGRKPADVRTEILRTVDEATEVMRAILDGEFKVEMRDMFGKVTGYRTATIKEVITAWKALADHALPVRNEMSGPNGGPIPMENVAPDVDAMLDRLSPEDLDAIKGIAERVHGNPSPE